jgi:hypothetical protein
VDSFFTYADHVFSDFYRGSNKELKQMLPVSNIISASINIYKYEQTV